MEKELEREEVKPDEKESVTLEGDAAILLWLEGKGAWNKWMEENPKAYVSFSGVDFSYKALKARFPDNENLQRLIDKNKDNETISFKGFKFSGETDFNYAKFSGEANFWKVTFSGEAYFWDATFSGVANFRDATFSGKANFYNAKFSGEASFIDAKFSGEASFIDATFSGKANFGGAKFSGKANFGGAIFSGEVRFIYATFSGEASFIGAIFSGKAAFGGAIFSGEASFIDAKFSGEAFFIEATFSGEASFIDATFSGEARFIDATFSGEAYFRDATFSDKASFIDAKFSGKASFHDVTFSGRIDYKNSNFESTLLFEPQEAENIKSLNFKGAAFEKLFTITGNYNCIPDLRQTKTSHHVDLSNLTVELNRDNWPLKKALDSEDSERLCRLKEIAESNKNHKRALAFNADELRASRWGALNPFQSILDCIYSVTSNYGQSIARPFCLLVLSIFMFASYTSSHSNNIKIEPLDKMIIATEISVATVTPFLSMSKNARQEGLKILHDGKRIRWFNAMSYLHAGISFIFIFLIGLGIRNRFRI